MNHSLRVLNNSISSSNDWNISVVQIYELHRSSLTLLVPPHHGISPFAAVVDHASRHQDQDCNKIKILLLQKIFSIKTMWLKTFFSNNTTGARYLQMYSGQSLKTPACRKVCKTYSTIDSDSRKQP